MREPQTDTERTNLTLMSFHTVTFLLLAKLAIVNLCSVISQWDHVASDGKVKLSHLKSQKKMERLDPKSFRSKGGDNRLNFFQDTHAKNVHSRERPFVCDVCDYSCSNKVFLPHTLSEDSLHLALYRWPIESNYVKTQLIGLNHNWAHIS